MITIKQLPETERPREKLIQFGPGALSNTELLAIVLGHGYRGKSSITLAQELLKKFDGLRNLINAPFSAAIKSPGFGPAKYAQVHAGIELSKRHLQDQLIHESTLQNTQKAKIFIRETLHTYSHEVLLGLFLDVHHRLITYEALSTGCLESVNVHIRQVIKRLLHHNAAGLIIAHNHPSGQITPSQSDIEATKSLQKALQLFETPLLDHFIVAKNQIFSFAEHNLL